MRFFRLSPFPRAGDPVRLAAALAAGLLAFLSPLVAAPAAEAAGRVQVKVLAQDTGEPLSFADILLIPADTTLRKIGGFTNQDGVYLGEAPPGLYRIQARAISYSRKVVTDVRIEEGRLFPVTVSLAPEALVQEEVVVEARANQSTESALLQQRRKATAVGDAVSSEQVRRSADRDAGEVLKRVTGLNVEDGKYVFVRGLGERYSSTELDGVRLSSPEPNKRVVPLDLLPAALVDNIVVQKTYTADRPAEFGGGDVQVKTKDFPGRRSWAVQTSATWVDGATGRDLGTYAGSPLKFGGSGIEGLGLPGLVSDLAGGKKVVPGSRFDPTIGFTGAQRAAMGSSFDNVWTPTSRTAPWNSSFQLSYGDEVRLFGRSLGLVGTVGYGRRYDHRDERQRYFTGQEIRYDYDVDRSTQSATGGGKLGLSYRLTPANSVHLRGVYTRNQDDEVRRYVGFATDRGRNQQGARLMYTERSIWTGSVEGNHEFKGLAASRFDWRASLSGASRQQPDRRESIYEQVFRDDPLTGEPVPTWVARSTADGITRESADLDERGDGLDASWATPFRAWGGGGKVTVGYGYQLKDREALLRRFSFSPAAGGSTAAPPESLFADPSWTGTSTGAQLVETTRDDDNYRGYQKQVAGFLSAEVPMGARVRAILGVRVERGVQRVESFSLLPWGRITAVGDIDETDWLPSVNLVWSPSDRVNLRAAASRTLSRPDLRELSPTNAIEYQGGLRTRGNPDLDRARIDNYDLRVETFPGLSEVFAAGVYYKRLDDPIEQVIRGGDEPYLEPRNSLGGFNTGLELELRTNLGRVLGPLDRFFVNANFSTIRSEVETDPGVTLLGSTSHPLQGQADRLFNVGLGYQTAGGGLDLSFLYNYTGTRLEALGVLPLPDMYAQPVSAFDVAANVRLSPLFRLKLAGKNLNSPTVRTLQGEEEVLRYRNNASFQVTLNVGQ